MGRKKATIKMCRASGKPMLNSDIEAYESEFKIEFDKAEAECTQGIDATGKPVVDMLTLQGKLAEVDKTLRSKYPNETEVIMPKTQSEWRELVDKWGAVSVCKLLDGSGVALVIMDETYL